MLREILSDCNRARANPKGYAVGKPQACAHNVQNGKRQQKPPAIVHQLVIAEARQRAPHPHIQKQKTENLEHKPEQRKNRA